MAPSVDPPDRVQSTSLPSVDELIERSLVPVWLPDPWPADLPKPAVALEGDGAEQQYVVRAVTDEVSCVIIGSRPIEGVSPAAGATAIAGAPAAAYLQRLGSQIQAQLHAPNALVTLMCAGIDAERVEVLVVTMRQQVGRVPPR